MNSVSSCVDSFIQGREGFKKRSIRTIVGGGREHRSTIQFSKTLSILPHKILKKKKKNSPLSNELMNPC